MCLFSVPVLLCDCSASIVDRSPLAVSNSYWVEILTAVRVHTFMILLSRSNKRHA